MAGGAPALAQARASSPRLEELRRQELRVARVAYRLAVANRAYCAKALSPRPGFVMHAIDQYEAGDRARVVATFGLGADVGVIAVVPSSPADKAGLKADDRIVAVNGRALRGGTAVAGDMPSRAAVQHAEDIIQEEMRKGAVTLRVMDRYGPREVRFAPDVGCSSNVELLPGEATNAWADGAGVVIGAGLLARCRTDDDLALVIAHELAHNLLGHSRIMAAAHEPGTAMGIRATVSASLRKAEEDADRLAINLTVAARYDVSRAEAFMSTLLDGRDVASNSGTHPATARRLGLLKAEIAAALAT